ncbi:MAG: hypothetical protein E5W74_09880 [Mesorhizobium sp.]|uniref:hypothetical protein n=1 Tax=Mesorhizobium sp. TaxID=1871066 RepID=UPI00121D47F1|nr:hypothetical protein [Mesorhizobium sp.]TIT12385.1 MAG: hypothetical protein E5W74_09880 [Mesorhizobium sp.]
MQACLPELTMELQRRPGVAIGGNSGDDKSVAPPAERQLISTVSVILLVIVSWSSASQSPLLVACLLGGAATSIAGMFCRWLSYQIEKRLNDR